MNGEAIERRRANGDLGGTMRLGSYAAHLQPGSLAARIYGTSQIVERHRHRYEVNMNYRPQLEAAGMRFSGMSPDGMLPEIIEIPNHPWFIGVQFHPELRSRPFRSASAVRLLHRSRRRAEPVGLGRPTALLPQIRPASPAAGKPAARPIPWRPDRCAAMRRTGGPEAAAGPRRRGCGNPPARA